MCGVDGLGYFLLVFVPILIATADRLALCPCDELVRVAGGYRVEGICVADPDKMGKYTLGSDVQAHVGSSHFSA